VIIFIGWATYGTLLGFIPLLVCDILGVETLSMCS
jgi:hypothetical protein